MITSVADKHKTAGLAGVVAGQTAISTVGKEGLGLTYRGYAIEDLARDASFEEVAYLLIHEELPTPFELGEYQCRLMGLRELPDALREILRWIPASAHPMDVLRSGCSALGCLEPEHRQADQEKIADRLLATFPSMLLDWYLTGQRKERINLRTTQPSLAGHFLQLLHGTPPENRAASGDERFADSVCGARVQCIDLRRPDRRLDAVRLLLGRYGGDRHACGAACTAGPTRRPST